MFLIYRQEGEVLIPDHFYYFLEIEAGVLAELFYGEELVFGLVK